MKRRAWAVVGVLAAGAAAAPPARAEQTNFIGLAAAVRPRYEGADRYKGVPLPVINYEYGNFFISPRAGLPALGLKWSPLPEVSAGVFVGMDFGRDESDSSRLRGMGDIDFHAAYGAYAEWTPGRFRLGAGYRQAAKSGYGGVLELRTSYQLLRADRDTFTVGLSTEWANDDSMQTWFGVTSGQAARSGGQLRPYEASAGFKNAAVFATWKHRFDNRWSLITTAGVKTLLGDARDSPIVERETALFGGIGVVYAF